MGELVIVVAGLAVLCVVLASVLRRRPRRPGGPHRRGRGTAGRAAGGGRSDEADDAAGDGGGGDGGGGDGGGGD